LVKDKEEGIPQHQMLCEILGNKPEMIIGDAYQHLAHVIRIFIKIYKKKTSNTEINNMINQLMLKLTQNPEIFAKIQNTDFTAEEKKKIDQLLVP